MAEEKAALEHIYDLYCALISLDDLGGKLVFYRNLDAKGTATAAAANIAGAVSFGVDPSADSIKRALHEGICDFMVNHLNEALRILKNEIRKRQPVSVCLHAREEDCIAEMIERGVQPDILTADMAEFVERGARVLVAAAARPNDKSVAWSVAERPARWLPELDEIAARSLGPTHAGTTARQRWLRFAPRYVGRTLHHQRFLRMTAAESAQFLTLVREASASREIAVPVTVSIDGSIVLAP